MFYVGFSEMPIGECDYQGCKGTIFISESLLKYHLKINKQEGKTWLLLMMNQSKTNAELETVL
jgi:hypothetical protein